MSAAEQDEYATWPTMLREIAGVVGRDCALRLAAECGGVTIYIPSEVQPGHPWCRAVGVEDFGKLAKVFGGQRIDLPRGSFVRLAKAEIIDLHAKGVSRRQIAFTLRVTERHVRRVLEGFPEPEDERQQKLF